MCTSIVEIIAAEGAGKSADGWFPVTGAVVSYDHPHHALLEDAIAIDFVNPARGPSARAAVELTLDSAKALSAALIRAIAAAEIEESERPRKLDAAMSAAPSFPGLSVAGQRPPPTTVALADAGACSRL
jgi:hypothetical protein